MNSIWSTKSDTSAPRVFVGLSGGVDSAVAAALLKKQGYQVVGAFIRIALPGYPCSAGKDRLEAMRVAAHLGISFVEIDLSKAYQKRVFEISMREFARGRVPNPDTLCNREIKFGLFYDWCMERGAEYVATGHYAQVALEQGSTLLKVGADKEKDQSYFLALVPQERLRKTLFPIGHLQKIQVRARAAELGLPNAARKDSQGLCFLGSIPMSEMLERELPLKEGAVLSEGGAVVGSHRGAARYTLGQRHGFRAQSTSPLYVVAKDMEHNTITVSPNPVPTGVHATRVMLIDCNWIGEMPRGNCFARYRYRQALIPASTEGNEVVLLEPHFVPEGQSLVLYEGARCLGGGTVDISRLA